ncbi:MAG: helix-turn-helix domain-containing protein [Mycobacteriaceae bacterium]
MLERDVGMGADDAIAMLIARFRDREAADFETYFQFLVEPAQGVSLEPELLELLGTALLENMRAFLAFLSHDIGIDNVDAPLMTLEYVRRLAQSGVGVSAVISALRAMHKKVLGLLISEIRESGLTRDTALDVLDFFNDRSFGYVDRITEQLKDTHEAERERWLERQNSARVLGVLQLLADDEQIDIDAATSAIGYPLSGPHLAMILWTTEPGAHEPDMLRLERVGLEVAEALRIDSPLFISADQSTGWAWLPLQPGTADPIAEIRRIADSGEGSIRVAVGTIDSGVAGFRESHRRAHDARRVAVAGRTSRSVVAATDAEVRVAALMVDDLARTREWVQNTLGPLASNTAGDAKLRETLRIFLREGSSHTAAAEHLALHRNTVGYRVNKAVQRRGRPIADDQIEVEMALLACDQFHEAVLHVPR